MPRPGHVKGGGVPYSTRGMMVVQGQEGMHSIVC